MEDYEQLEELQGGSGRGRVYRARQKSTGTLFALRRATTRRTGVPALNTELAAVWQAELQRLRALRHTNLLALEAFFLDGEGGSAVAVAPLATGGSLEDAQFAAGGVLGGETLAWVANGIVQALCYLHARDPVPLAHRAIKPSNILFIAPVLGASEAPFPPPPGLDYTACTVVLDHALPQAPGVWGGYSAWDRAYLAPEVLRDEEGALASGAFAAAADVWALGATLFSVATGSPLGASPDTRAALREGSWTLTSAVGALKGPAELRWVALPEAMRDLIASTLRMDPDKRPSARTLQLHPALAALAAQKVQRDAEARLAEAEARARRAEAKISGLAVAEARAAAADARAAAAELRASALEAELRIVSPGGSASGGGSSNSSSSSSARVGRIASPLSPQPAAPHFPSLASPLATVAEDEDAEPAANPIPAAAEPQAPPPSTRASSSAAAAPPPAPTPASLAHLSPQEVIERLRSEGSAAVLLDLVGALVALTGGKGRRLERIALLSSTGVHYEQRCNDCVELGAPAALVAILRAHASAPALCEMVAAALRNIIPANGTCAESVMAAGAAPALVVALRTHSSHAGLADQVACALGNLASSEARAEGVQAAGACAALTSALYTHAGSAEVCEAVAVALGTLAGGSESRREACSMSGALPALMGALVTHCASTGVCESTCMALGNIAGGSAARREAAMDAGAASALVGVLKAHVAQPSVAGTAAAGIREVATGCEAHRSAAVEAGALPALIAALKAHASMPTVCEAACGAVRGLLTSSDKLREAAVSAGVLPPTITALRTHSSIASVCEVACGLLGNISAGPLEDACVAAGAVPAIVGALRAHLTQPGLCERAAVAMRNIMATSEANREAFSTAGAPSALVGILRAHSYAASVCEATCGALGNLAAGTDQKRRDACAAAGALPALVHVMGVNGGLPGVNLLAIRALGAISMANEGHREGLVAAGAVAVLCGVLNAHFGTQGITEAVSAVLYNIAMSTNPANKQAVVAGGAVPALVKAGKAQPGARKNVVAALMKLGYGEHGEKLGPTGMGMGGGGGGDAGNRGRSSTSMY